jgi:hypothetical protein
LEFIFQFAVLELESLVDLIWVFLSTGTFSGIVDTTADILEKLLLGLGEPLWGISGVELIEDFSFTMYSYPNSTGVNQTQTDLELEIFNDSGYVLSGWTYDRPAFGKVLA